MTRTIAVHNVPLTEFQIEQRGFLALRFIRMADEKRALNGDAGFASSSHQ
jgi:hypothetical protein